MTAITTKRTARTGAGIIAASALVFALALPALGTHVAPQLFQGNLTCAEATDGAYPFEYKLEPVTAGTKSDPASDFEVEITLHNTADGQTFDFEANIAVNAVFVKGGPGGNLYDYGLAGETADTGLHAPGNDAGTAVADPPWSGLSHISFCFGEEPEEEETPTPTPTPTPEEEEETPTPTPTPTPAGEEETPSPTPLEDVAGGTPTPGAALPDTAAAEWTGTPATALSLVLLASLGALVYLRMVRDPARKR